jgi:hypothetical protein
MMFYRTVRQFTNAISERRGLLGLNQVSNQDEFVIISDLIQNFLALNTVNSREEYLEWLDVWKHLHSRLIRLIKVLKKDRLNIENYWFNIDERLHELRVLANALYSHRLIMKDASQCNKIRIVMTQMIIEAEKAFA